MDGLALLRMIGGLGLVLGALAGALWLVRRYDIRLPGRLVDTGTQRIALVERLPIDAKRSVLLLRRDGREHLLLLAPEGNMLIEAGIVEAAPPGAAARHRRPEVPPARPALLGDRLAALRARTKRAAEAAHA